MDSMIILLHTPCLDGGDVMVGIILGAVVGTIFGFILGEWLLCLQTYIGARIRRVRIIIPIPIIVGEPGALLTLWPWQPRNYQRPSL